MWDLIASVPDHCLSFYFSIKPRLLFSSFGCCISKGSCFTDNWCKASNSPEIINKHISDKTHTWHINETNKQNKTNMFCHFDSYSRPPAPIAHLVECPLRGTGGHGFDPWPRHTKVVKKWYKLLLAWHSDLRGRARTAPCRNQTPPWYDWKIVESDVKPEYTHTL